MSVFYDEGKYRVRIVKQALGESSTGNPQFILRFMVLAKIESDCDSEVRQYERTMYRSITEKTIQYIVQDLQTLGFEGSGFRQLDPAVSGHHSFVGQEVEMWCKHDEYNGKELEKWSIATSPSDIEVKPLRPDKLRELENLYGKHLRAAAPVKPKPTPKIAEPAPFAEITDDDIPF